MPVTRTTAEESTTRASKRRRLTKESSPAPVPTSRKSITHGGAAHAAHHEVATRAKRQKFNAVTSPPLNALAALPKPQRPALHLFGWGSYEDGQLARDNSEILETDRPKLNPWIKQKIEEGAFGSQGAGLVAIAAGGFYTLFLDEVGRVILCSSF
jgi:regulator of chromosome condensation